MSSEWSQWQRITAFIPPGKALYRAAGPNVKNGIEMTLTPSAINYLLSLGIDGVFAVSTWPFLYPQPQQLEAKGIAYKWMTVQINPPTPAILQALWDFFSSHKKVLIYDGDGKWRSGMAVTAIQLYSTGGRSPPPFYWKNNGVERPEQIETLKALQKKLIGSASPDYGKGKGKDKDKGGKGSGYPDWYDIPVN